MEDYNDLIKAIKGFHDWKGIDFPQWFQKHMSWHVKSPLFPEWSQLFGLVTHSPLWNLQLTRNLKPMNQEGKHKVWFPWFLSHYMWVVKLRKKKKLCFPFWQMTPFYRILSPFSAGILWLDPPGFVFESQCPSESERLNTRRQLITSTCVVVGTRQGGRPEGKHSVHPQRVPWGVTAGLQGLRQGSWS